jgi:lactoylglutathione lyase
MADPRPRLGAAGIGVRDLERSVDFYTRILGMKVLMKLPLPDMDEVIVGFEGASTAVVLMQHHDPSGHDYTNTGGKLAFYLPDPVAVAEAIRAEGLEIVREPTPVRELGGVVIGFAKDPDGHLLELIQG